MTHLKSLCEHLTINLTRRSYEVLEAYIDDTPAFNLMLYIINTCMKEHISNNTNMETYQNWFFLDQEEVIRKTKLDNNQITECFETLVKKNLLHVKNQMYGNLYHVRVNTMFLDSLLNVFTSALEVSDLPIKEGLR